MKTNEILAVHGTDYKDMTIRLLVEADLIADIPEDARVIGIKPNLVTPTPASYGATTHPEVVAGIIEYLQSQREFDIVIAEGSWVGDKTSEAFEFCGYRALADEYGVSLFDTQKDGSYKTRFKDIEINVNNCYKGFDFLINVPVLKGHCQTRITCALKNMKGLIPNSEKRRFHTIGLHKPIAYLNSCIRQDFIVVDHICGDLDFEEGGNPVTRNTILAAKDPVLMDAYVCNLLGYSIDDVPYVRISEELGVGSADLSSLVFKDLDEGLDGFSDGSATELKPGKKVLDVSYAVDEVDSCSACYAMLIPALHRLKDEGLLDKLDGQIAIGQGHRGKSGKLGCGNCTAGFDVFVPGCPPSEDDIYQCLKDHLTL